MRKVRCPLTIAISYNVYDINWFNKVIDNSKGYCEFCFDDFCSNNELIVYKDDKWFCSNECYGLFGKSVGFCTTALNVHRIPKEFDNDTIVDIIRNVCPFSLLSAIDIPSLYNAGTSDRSLCINIPNDSVVGSIKWPHEQMFSRVVSHNTFFLSSRDTRKQFGYKSYRSRSYKKKPADLGSSTGNNNSVELNYNFNNSSNNLNNNANRNNGYKSGNSFNNNKSPRTKLNGKNERHNLDGDAVGNGPNIIRFQIKIDLAHSVLRRNLKLILDSVRWKYESLLKSNIDLRDVFQDGNFLYVTVCSRFQIMKTIVANNYTPPNWSIAYSGFFRKSRDGHGHG